MAEAQNQVSYIFTSPAVTAFPALLEPRKFKRNGRETGDPKFGGTWLLGPDHPDLAGVKAAAAKAAQAKWPGRSLAELKFPFSVGDKMCAERIARLKKEGKDDDGKGDFMKGHTLLKAGSKYRPKLAFIQNGKIIEIDDESLKVHGGKFYFGVQALIQVNFVAYDKINEDAKDGVTAYLQQVLTLNKGERLAGGQSAAEVFKGYAGKASEIDPTGGDDLMSAAGSDEIPF